MITAVTMHPGLTRIGNLKLILIYLIFSKKTKQKLIFASLVLGFCKVKVCVDKYDSTHIYILLHYKINESMSTV